MNNYIDFKAENLGEPLGVGATAEVYAYGKDKIIKIFRSRFSKEHVESEYRCSLAAEKTGLPVPKNFGICRVQGSGNPELDDCYAVVQERIDGISVMDKVMENPTMEACGRLITDLVALQVQMHRIEADAYGLYQQKDILRRNISWAPLLSEEEKERMYRLLTQLPAGNRICHGDYHMGNVLLTGHGMVCIDWCDITCGNPTADLARSLLIFRCEGVPDSIPKEVVELTIKMRDICWDFYLKAYREQGGVYDHLEEWLAVVAAARLFCEVEDNKQSMLRVVREYLSREA